MAIVHFTSHLQGYAPCDPVEVTSSTVGEALDAALADNDRLRSYVFDELGRLRRHIMVFVDGQAVIDRVGLGDPISPDSKVYVMQALSGG